MLFVVNTDVFDDFLITFRLKLLKTVEAKYTFYDTHFDELLKNGHYLAYFGDFLELKTLDSKLIAKEKKTDGVKFFWDVHDKKFRETLENFIEYRALLKKATLSFKDSSYLAQNDYNKGVFRVSQYKFDENIVICLEPIKGYNTDLLRANDFLNQSQKLHSLFDMVKKEVKPKNRVKLTREMSSKDAIKVLLSDIYKDMREQEAGLIANIDSEFLHYYRVNLRKARALLSQFKTVFAKDEIAHLQQGLSKAGKTTNQARDLDVYWLKVREYQEEKQNIDLSSFLNYLKQSSDKEYIGLAKFFKSNEYNNICIYYEDALRDESANGISANINIVDLASKKLKKLYKKLIIDGSLLHINSEDETFHSLRIDCKKIRYLLEFFEDILDEQKAPMAIKLIKNLQGVLGNFQDLSIQQKNIIGLADSMSKQMVALESKTLISIGMLVGDLEREQKKQKKLFFQNFNELLKHQNKELFNNLFIKAANDDNSGL